MWVSSWGCEGQRSMLVVWVYHSPLRYVRQDLWSSLMGWTGWPCVTGVLPLLLPLHWDRVCTTTPGFSHDFWGSQLRFSCIHIKHFSLKLYTHTHIITYIIYTCTYIHTNLFMHWLFSHNAPLQIWRSPYLLRLASQQTRSEHVFPNKKVPLNHYYRHSVRFRKNAPCGQLSTSSPTGCLPTPFSPPVPSNITGSLKNANFQGPPNLAHTPLLSNSIR